MSMKTASYEIIRNSTRPRSLGRAAARMRMLRNQERRIEGLAYQDLGALLCDLRLEQDFVARAMEFIVLTACRMSEACQAEWSEFDFQAHVWTIPAQRSKSCREHRIPLSDEAIAVLEQVRGVDPTWVFPGVANARAGNPALQRMLKRLGHPVSAIRASRTTFRNWATERRQHAKEVVALCLGHAWEPEVPRLPARLHERFDACRALMADWGQWCVAAQPGA